MRLTGDLGYIVVVCSLYDRWWWELGIGDSGPQDLVIGVSKDDDAWCHNLRYDQ